MDKDTQTEAPQPLDPEEAQQIRDQIAAFRQEDQVAAQQAATPGGQEQTLSGFLTLMVYRMGGRVMITRNEMNTIFKRMERQSKTLTVHYTGPNTMVLELTQVQRKEVAPIIEGGNKIEA